MAEVCEVGLKILRANFLVGGLFSAGDVSHCLAVVKNSSYINTKPENFMQLF